MNIGSVRVLSFFNIKDESSFADDVVSFLVEVLMPHVFGLRELDVSVSSIFTDVHGDLVVSSWLDASGVGVEDEDLVVATLVVVTDDSLVSCPGESTT